MFFLIDVFELFCDYFACFICLDIEPFEVEHDCADIAFQILSHILLSVECLLVLVDFLYELLLLLAGQVVDVTLDLLDSSGDLYLQLPVLSFQVRDFGLEF